VHRFYAPHLRLGNDVELPEDEAHHLSKVLRLAPGDAVVVFDGRGVEADATVQQIANKRVTLRPIASRPGVPEPAIAVTLAQGLLKSDKMDRVVRDAVMLGAHAIQPFVSAHIDVPRAALTGTARQERWERTVISSVKQCSRSVVPAVLPTVEFRAALATAAADLTLVFVEPGVTGSEVETLESLETKVPAKATVFIGPEGGWAPSEIEAARDAGALMVTLGRRVLRADAAGAAALAVLRYIWKDF